jgi:hypothetical protein
LGSEDLVPAVAPRAAELFHAPLHVVGVANVNHPAVVDRLTVTVVIDFRSAEHLTSGLLLGDLALGASAVLRAGEKPKGSRLRRSALQQTGAERSW